MNVTPAGTPSPVEPEVPKLEHHASHELGFELPPPARVSRVRVVAVTIAVLATLGAAFVIGWLPRLHAKAELEADTKGRDVAALKVDVMTPTVASSDRRITLPGSVQPLEETIVYPRTSGYVRKWLVDIGEKVKEGDLLAEIDTPELDQQLAQARAQLAQADSGIALAKANALFSKQNLERYRLLVPAGVATQMDLDQKKAQADVDEANVKVAIATVEVQRANVNRLIDLKVFAHVTAPFGGTVTARTVERGTLVTEGTSTPLFKVTATDPVRVFIQVPQDVASSMVVGGAASVKVREFGGRIFEGIIAHTSGVLDATTRTMTTEVRVPNPKGEIFSGMYVEVALALPTPHRVFAIPGTALMDDAKGQRVATVTAEGKIHLVPVIVERDTGSTIELSSGLDGAERVVKLPNSELVEGRVVDVGK